MRITLDQPTFLTSLTGEKAGENQEETGSSGLPDFLNCLQTLNQTQEDVTDTKSANTAPMDLVKDEVDSEVPTLLETVDNLLIDLGYLTQTLTPPETTPLETLINQASGNALPSETSALTMTDAKLNKAMMADTYTAPMKPMNLEETQTAAKVFNANQENEADSHSASPEKTPIDTWLKNEVVMNPSKARQMAMMTQPKENKDIVDLKPLTEMKEKNKVINSFIDQNKSDVSMVLPTQQPINEKVTEKTEVAAMPLTPQDIKTTQALHDFGAWVQTKVNTNIVQPDLSASSFKAETMAATLNAAKMNYPAEVEVHRDLSAMDINMANYRVNIKIYPPELGKITASLKMDKKSTSLEVIAETKEVKAMLQNHLSLLKEQFNQSNIQLDKVEVYLAGDQQRNAKHEGEEPYQELEEPMAEEANQKPSASIKKRSTAENAVDAYV